MSYAIVGTTEPADTKVTPKMNAEIKQKWLDALRSGKYSQAQERLHTEEGFCCLGVLCEVYIKEHGLDRSLMWEPGTGIDEDELFIFGSSTYLPTEVTNWAKVPRTGQIRTPEKMIDLADLNDGGTTFQEIADLIEEYL